MGRGSGELLPCLAARRGGYVAVTGVMRHQMSRGLILTRKFALCAKDTEEGVVCKFRLSDPLDYSLEGKAILFSVFGVAFL